VPCADLSKVIERRGGFAPRRAMTRPRQRPLQREALQQGGALRAAAAWGDVNDGDAPAPSGAKRAADSARTPAQSRRRARGVLWEEWSCPSARAYKSTTDRIASL